MLDLASWWEHLSANYLPWLLIFSALVTLFELTWPARPQRLLRRWMWSDALHLIFNGNFLGAWIVTIGARSVSPLLESALSGAGLKDALFLNALAEWGLIPQLIVGFVILDFTQWLVHNTLHRVNFLWEIHKVHHSVKDGEMDWIVSLRFSWLEIVIYKSVMFVPTVWFGLSAETLFFHAVFGTLIGHLNHANLTWDYGPLRYLLNSPRMHLYHHAYDAPPTGQNFGISLSCWDWIFGTDHLPDAPCPKIGFPGVEELPNDFFGQAIWPLPHAIKAIGFKGIGSGTRPLTSALGALALFGLYEAQLPPSPKTPMFGEGMASSRPVTQSALTWRAVDAEGFERALKAFGDSARAQGWAHPEHSVSALELAAALGAPRLKVLDVRGGKDAQERFERGHVPSAQLVSREDYSGGEIPGLSLPRDQLEALLRSKGVNEGDEVVLMGDGGPEPYRLWWTLLEVGGLKARVLDGGLAAWKQTGEGIAEGRGVGVRAGDVALRGEGGGLSDPPSITWRDLARLRARHPNLQLADTRALAEFMGQDQHKEATRAGRIPGARWIEWTEALKEVEVRGVRAPVLKGPSEVRELMRQAGMSLNAPTLTYCQSGTRSAAVYFALLQAGQDPRLLWNYDGSWAEYSRSGLEVATGAP